MSRVPPYHLVLEKIASVNPDDDVTEEILQADRQVLWHVTCCLSRPPTAHERREIAAGPGNLPRKLG